MPRRISRELKTLSVWALSLAISGCIGTGGIAPQGQALDANQLATDEAIQQAVQDAHWPPAQWWRAYGDPQLDHWVDLATRHSPSLAMAAARVREARSMAGLAESAEALQINSDTTLKRHNWPKDQFYGPGELSGANTWDNNSSLGLSYALDLWGRESNATERAVDLAHMSAAEARQAQLELQNNVVRAYIQLSLQYANRDIVAATLAQQQQILDLANKRLNAGIGTHFDVSQAETPLPETHRQLDALDEAIALSRNQLAALAGMGPGQGAKLRRPSLSLAAPLALPSSVPAQLLGQRPDVVASRWQVAAQARGIDVAHAGFYPNVDLVGSLGYMTTGGGMLEFLAGKKFNYSVGPAITLPIFDGGRLRADLDARDADYDLAVAQYNKTLVQALGDIGNTLSQLRDTGRQIQAQQHATDIAQQSYDTVVQRYGSGIGSYLDVLSIEQQLLQAQRQLASLNAGQITLSIQLMQALGGGYGASNVASTTPATRTE
ncbi:efflux transporter outer membrane subunit [Pseudomonas sp. UBA4034]|uniref:efflux transporter outer membrane subunit n=1 Tax=Pseudomonas sp. UBA4034 TaxID=1947315 RepID=UPI00257C7C88|nr:efflux transporter outer membrane subunit [Pseudomonas sp. UBA4034]